MTNTMFKKWTLKDLTQRKSKGKYYYYFPDGLASSFSKQEAQDILDILNFDQREKLTCVLHGSVLAKMIKEIELLKKQVCKH